MLGFCINANAQGMPPKLQSILKQSMAADGYLTQKMHKEFWGEIRKLGSSKEIELMKTSLSLSVLGAQEYQKELWESAKISHKNQRAVKTLRLIELEIELQLSFEKSLNFPKDSANYRQAMNSYKQQIKISLEDSKRLLDSAAKRSSMTLTQGQRVSLDMNMINTVLNNINSSFKRLENLLDESWSSQ